MTTGLPGAHLTVLPSLCLDHWNTHAALLSRVVSELSREQFD